MYVGYMSCMSYVTYISISINHLKPLEIIWFLFSKSFKKFLLIYKDGEPKL